MRCQKVLIIFAGLMVSILIKEQLAVMIKNRKPLQYTLWQYSLQIKYSCQGKGTSPFDNRDFNPLQSQAVAVKRG
jgi:hypothetical protein